MKTTGDESVVNDKETREAVVKVWTTENLKATAVNLAILFVCKVFTQTQG